MCPFDDDDDIQTETSASFLDKTLNAGKLAAAIAVPVGTGLTSASIQTVLVVICKEPSILYVNVQTLYLLQCWNFEMETGSMYLPIYLISGNPPKGDRKAFETGPTCCRSELVQIYY